MALTPCNITINEQGMERACHGTALFPIACYDDDLEKEAVIWHWHPELEAAIVSRGSALVAAGADRFIVKEGEGFFINSGVPHAAWIYGESDCHFHSIVFHPRIVGGIDSIFWQKYVQPLLTDAAQKWFCFDYSKQWHAEALRMIETAWTSCAEEPPGYDLQMRHAVSELAFLLLGHQPALSDAPSAKALREEQRIKQMLQFIQENYDKEVGVAKIAESALISESECLRCFRHTIGTSPIQYLKQFRIQKAAELLKSTEWSVAEIGARCGFPDTSYFIKTFRQMKGCTPAEYRRGDK